MKKLCLLAMLGIMLVLTGCGSSSTSTEKEASFSDCFSNVTNTCIADTLANVSDEFIRNCIEGNIASKTGLALALDNNTLTTGDVKDIDTLARECVSYKLSNNNVDSDNTPLFNSFLVGAGGAFIGSYLASSFLGGSRYNMNMPIDNSQRSAYYQNYNKDEDRKRRGGLGGFVSRSYVTGLGRSYSTSSFSSANKASTLGRAGSSWSSKSSSSSSSLG